MALRLRQVKVLYLNYIYNKTHLLLHVLGYFLGFLIYRPMYKGKKKILDWIFCQKNI
jgi:glycopeptide antibiotics resistance protein